MNIPNLESSKFWKDSSYFPPSDLNNIEETDINDWCKVRVKTELASFCRRKDSSFPGDLGKLLRFQEWILHSPPGHEIKGHDHRDLIKSQKNNQDPVSFSGDQWQYDHLMCISRISALSRIVTIIYFVLSSINTLLLLICNINLKYEQLP